MSIAVKIVATSVDLAPKARTLAVAVTGEDGNPAWNYYSITLGTRKGNFVPVLKEPPVIAEGFITFDKKLYKYSFRDFFRGRVNVNQQPQPAIIASKAARVGTTAVSESTPIPAVQSGISGLFRDDFNEDTNLAWGEQIDSLLHLVDQEEEWGHTSIAQSGRPDEGSAVPTADQAPE